MSEPVAVHASRQAADTYAATQQPHTEDRPDSPTVSPQPIGSDATVQPQVTGILKTSVRAAATFGPGSEPGSVEGVLAEADATTLGQKNIGAGKTKVDIQTLEQFIKHAYGRKGQRVSLKSKVEKAIAQDPRLEDGALSRLLELAAEDTVLAVPRQLLLVSQDIDGYPGLRAALRSFVSTVMLRHPVFADTNVQGALRNLPEANPAADALVMVAAFSPAEEDDKEPLKSTELQALRRNAVHLFATWLASNRGMNTNELAALLFQVLWAPAARDLADDSARLRALTEIDQPAGVGLACQRFRQQAIEARSSQDQAQRDANELRMLFADTDAQRLLAEEQRDRLTAELQALRESTAAEMAELIRQHEVQRIHQGHEQEQLRGRLVRRLDDGVEMLQVGLTALRNKTPRVEVMMERAEHVVDALRAEMNNLREE